MVVAGGVTPTPEEGRLAAGATDGTAAEAVGAAEPASAGAPTVDAAGAGAEMGDATPGTEPSGITAAFRSSRSST
jgi:hypothetical protein